MKTKEIKVKFEDGKFVPLEKISLEEGAVIEIEIVQPKKKKFAWSGALKREEDFSWEGSLQDLKLTSVELQHKMKEYW